MIFSTKKNSDNPIVGLLKNISHSVEKKMYAYPLFLFKGTKIHGEMLWTSTIKYHIGLKSNDGLHMGKEA